MRCQAFLSSMNCNQRLTQAKFGVGPINFNAPYVLISIFPKRRRKLYGYHKANPLNIILDGKIGWRLKAIESSDWNWKLPRRCSSADIYLRQCSGQHRRQCNRLRYEHDTFAPSMIRAIHSTRRVAYFQDRDVQNAAGLPRESHYAIRFKAALRNPGKASPA